MAVVVRSVGRGVPYRFEPVEVLGQVSLVQGRAVVSRLRVAVGSTPISWESIAKAGGVWSMMSGFRNGFCERIGVLGVCAGVRRGSLRRVLGVSRVEVCNGCPGPGEPGRTECA